LAKVGIIYFSHTDITGRLVKSAVSGIESVGVDVFSHQIMGAEIVNGRFVNLNIFNELEHCHALIFASPTYMGGVSAQFKAFADATSELWESQKWSGKIAAGITSGTGLNGDQTSTLQYFSTLASQHGMYWVGIDASYGKEEDTLNRLGCQLGVVAQSDGLNINQTDLETARYLGVRVSKLAQKLI
jgi:NAD(P)H dehydrogenase (quinone)